MNSINLTYPLILKSLASYAHINSLKIIVARNYATLPLVNSGRDVDMIISYSDIKIWIRLFKLVANDLGLKIRIGVAYAYCIKLFISVDDSHEIEFDLLPRFVWRGVNWLDTASVIERSLLHDQYIYKPSPSDEFLITFNHSFLHGGFYPVKYHNILSSLYNQNPTLIKNAMLNVYGSDTKILLKLITLKQFSNFNIIANRTRIKCILRYFRRQPAYLFSGLCKSYLYEMKIILFKQFADLNNAR